VETPKRKRPRVENLEDDGTHKKVVTTKYFMPKLEHGSDGSEISSTVPVCKNLFIKTLCISRDRVQLLAKRYLESGTATPEARGGNRKAEKFNEKRISVKSFIESVPVLESHYCRGRQVNRQYLSSELSIKVLWEKYEQICEPQNRVKYEFFRSVFVTDYNIGFGSPAKDCCSTCLSLKEEIKITRDPEKKSNLKVDLALHKRKAKAFFDELRTAREGELTLSFDCQKNQIIPKIPDQDAYYLRQMYIYNFTVCQGNSHEKLSKDKVFSYIWLENEFKKGSNQIASAVYHRLKSTDLTGIRIVKLVSDGCGGQNKNSMLIGMMSKFLLHDAPPTLKIIKVVYPIVGHSFIPPDRVFAQIEKDVKKHSTLLTDQDYIEIFNKHATVIRLGDNCPVLDWKNAVFEVLKKPANWHFKLQPCKRIIVSKAKKTGNCVVRGELHYNQNIGEGKSLLKRGKKISSIDPKRIAKGVQLKPAKLTDLNKLLSKHFMPNWREKEQLIFFKELFEEQGLQNLCGEPDRSDEDSDMGDIIEENGQVAV
jgi:hypothetical protein